MCFKFINRASLAELFSLNCYRRIESCAHEIFEIKIDKTLFKWWWWCLTMMMRFFFVSFSLGLSLTLFSLLFVDHWLYASPRLMNHWTMTSQKKKQIWRATATKHHQNPKIKNKWTTTTTITSRNVFRFVAQYILEHWIQLQFLEYFQV